MGNVAGSGLKVFTGAAKAMTTVLTATTAGVMTLGTAAVNSYAEYEQLVGGVETLFGTGGKSIQDYANETGKRIDEITGEYAQLMEAQNTVLQNASEAYKTAGLSANEYMETVTSFAAALKQSTENETEAAKAADQAVIDMADNANKMGTNMELIQNAYQGFAKQNYTMLDNLKLGYGGTKTEMERLLADAQELTGIEYDINNLSDVYEAIHVIQTELGITGTTAKEASSTISGSLNAMKSAWSNLVTGIASDSQNFDTLVDNFVESVGVAAENILPRVETSIIGVGKLIENLFPTIVDALPGLINNVLPSLIESGTNIIGSLIEGIHTNADDLTESAFDIVEMLIEAFTEFLPSMMGLGARLLTKILEGILENLPLFIENIGLMLSDIGEVFYDLMPDILALGGQIVLELINGIIMNLPQIATGAMEIITQIVTTVLELLPQIIELGLQLIVQLALGIAQALPQLIPTIINVLLSIVDTLINNIDLLVDGAIALVIGLAEGIINALPQLIQRVPEIIVKLGDAFVRNAGKLATAALELIVTLGKGLVENIPELIKNIPEIIDAIVTSFTSFADAIWEIGKNIVDGIWNGLSDNWDSIITWIKESASNIWQAVKEVLGIASPSKKFKWLGEMCVAGFDKGMEGFEKTDTITKGINASMKTIEANTAVSRMSSVEKGGNVKIYLEGDAGKLFRVIRVENDKFVSATGYYPLAQGD